MMTKQQQQFAEENHGLIFSFLKKYELSVEEYYDIAAIAFCNAVINYQECRATFSTYAYRAMWNAVNLERRRTHQKTKIPEEKLYYYENEIFEDESDKGFLNTFASSSNPEEDTVYSIILQELSKCLSEHQRKILYCLLSDYTYVEGDIYCTTQIIML